MITEETEAIMFHALVWARENLGKHTRPSPVDNAIAAYLGEGAPIGKEEEPPLCHQQSKFLEHNNTAAEGCDS